MRYNRIAFSGEPFTGTVSYKAFLSEWNILTICLTPKMFDNFLQIDRYLNSLISNIDRPNFCVYL